jgi:predicted O-linked N-acetylglucosamine transferase (SPINDLY family)
MYLGKNAEAEESFQQAIALWPASGYFNNLGNLQKQQGRLDDAIAAYRQAVGHDPRYAKAHFNLGIVFRAKNELDEATESFRRAVNADPSNAEALAGLGQTLAERDQTEEAVTFLQQAASLLPDEPALHAELGDAFQTLGRFEEAAREYQKSLEINPCLPQVWFAAGCAQLSREEYVPAVACFREALAIEPDWPEAQHNLGKALFQLGRVNEAVRQFQQAADSDRPALPQAMVAVAIPGSSSADNQAILEARRAWAEHYLPNLAPRPAKRDALRSKAANAGARLRIGYVSSFLHRPNWMKPVWALLNNHDRAAVELHIFSDAPASAIPPGLSIHAGDHFHDITELSNEAVAEQIKRSGVDLLVDLNGFSKIERLEIFALRPAPVIAGWFNMYATTGMRCYDYLIGDGTVIPPEEEKFYSEKIARVPGSYLSFEVTYAVPDVVPAPCASGRPVTFGCLAPQYKITVEVIAAWTEILRRADESSLILKNTALASHATREYLYAEFERHNISRERIRLEGPSDHEEFLRTYNEIDIALDTFPYNGGTTTTEAIWQGVPVVSFWGDRWVARISASILRAANLSQFVERNLAEYISSAVRIATSPETPGQLAELRRNMRSKLRASPVCDTQSFARNMEKIYRELCDA